MANTEVGLKLAVDAKEASEYLKKLKSDLKIAEGALLAIRDKFGETSKEAIQAGKVVAELRDKIQGAKEQANLFDPGKRFQAFTTAASQLAAGFSAVQGAMALAGSESEDLQKTLVKVQGAMALSQGLSELKDLGKSYEQLKTTAINAFNAIKGAIGSTGIGLLVVALGTIVAYWDDIKAAVSGVSAEQKKLNAESQKNLKTQQEKLDAIGAQDNILKLQGKSEKDILQIKIKQTDETIKAAEINLKNSIETTKAQVAAAQRNKDILQGIITFVTAPLSVVLKGIDAIGNALGKNLDLYNKFTGGIASLVFDPAEVKAEGDAAIKEQEKALTDLKNQRAGLQLAVNDIDKKAADKRLEDQKKLNEEKKAFEKEYTAFIKEENEKRSKLQMDSFDKERFEIEKKYADLIAKAKKYGLDTSEIEALRFQESKDLVNKSTAEDTKVVIDANAKKLGDFTAMVPKMATLQTTLTANQQTEANIRKGIDEQELAAKQQMADQTAGILNGLSNVLGAQTKAGKAAAIAAIVIEQAASISRVISNTAAANAKAVAASPLTGGMPFVALNTVSAAVSIASSIANARKSIQQINSNNQNVSGGSGGGGISTAAPVAPALAPQVEATQVNTAAVNQMGNRAARAYVLNSDIQNENQRNAYIDRNASIGNP